MRKSTNIFSKFFKKNNFSKIKNYKLYKTKEQLDFAKKRKSLTFNVKINHTQRSYKNIFLSTLLLVWLTFILWIVYIFTGPTFRVKYIEPTKQDNIVDLNIALKSLENFYGKVIFDVEPKNLLDRLTSYQEGIKSISLNKKFPNTLLIDIEAYAPAFNVSINQEKYILLENGSLVPTKHYNPKIPYIGVENNFWKNKYLSYKKIFPEKTIKKIQKFLKQISLNIPAWITANYYQNERELHIVINNTSIIIFSLDDDMTVEQQIKNMAILHKESNAILNGKNAYIDLRIKNKAFLCSFENVWLCRYNLSFLYPPIERPKIEPSTLKIEQQKAKEEKKQPEKKPAN